MNRIHLAFILWSMHLVLFGQDTLTLQKAIDIALQNNNLLKASQKELSIAERQVSIGNAGYLPSINVGAGNTIASNNIRQELVDGRRIVRDNARASNLNANVSFNWLLFDGFRRSNVYDRLKTTYAQASAQTKTDMENTIGAVSNAYFELVRQSEIADAYANNLTLYQERLRLAEARQSSGLGSKSDVLLTKVDINTQRSLLLRQQILVTNAQTTLNQVLNRNLDSPVLLSRKQMAPLIDTSSSFNGNANALKVTEKAVDIAYQQLKESNSSFLPKLSLVAGYNYTRTESQAGLTLLNRSTGPTAGLTFTWNIFDGFNKTRERNIGLMRIDIAKYMHEENKLAMHASYQKAMTQFKTASRILVLETESYALAVESNEIAKQRYQAGLINLFEYKETQLALEASKIRLANARYESLAIETELNRLSGTLLK